MASPKTAKKHTKKHRRHHHHHAHHHNFHPPQDLQLSNLEASQVSIQTCFVKCVILYIQASHKKNKSSVWVIISFYSYYFCFAIEGHYTNIAITCPVLMKSKMHATNVIYFCFHNIVDHTHRIDHWLQILVPWKVFFYFFSKFLQIKRQQKTIIRK